MAQPITEQALASFIGTDCFKEATRIRNVSTAFGTADRDNQFAEMMHKAKKQLEITMQARGYYRVSTILKHEKSLEYHLKNRAGITMSWAEICDLTADRNEDGTAIL